MGMCHLKDSLFAQDVLLLTTEVLVNDKSKLKPHSGYQETSLINFVCWGYCLIITSSDSLYYCVMFNTFLRNGSGG